MKKVLIICSLSQNVYNFRTPLILKLQSCGYEVVTSGFDDDYKKDLEEIGVRYISIGGNYKSSNLIECLRLRSRYKKLIKSVFPDIVFTFMPKPNTFGVLAAHDLNIKNIFSMVEGAGDAFSNSSLKWKIIKRVECYLYKKAFKYSKKIFFLNNDDLEEFVNLKLLAKEQSVLLYGVGVDLAKFHETPLNTNSSSFIMISRMLITKGVFDYIRCAEIVKNVFPNATFNYLGSEGTIKLNSIQEWIDNGTIKYLGTVKDVRPFLEDCVAFILPSLYREGLPMSIMEAQASGRCVITTNNVGCKDTVIDSFNGFIVEKGDYVMMAEKCIALLENKSIASTMGHNARKFAEERFDENKINKTIVSILEEE